MAHEHRTYEDARRSYEDERKTAVAAVEEAGDLLRGRYGDLRTVTGKGSAGDVVTDLDLASERIVLERIRRRFPADRILSEEAGELPGAGERTWLVDPLDGSNNVAIGLCVYVVGVGLCLGERPVVGVVHEPVTQQTWHAVAGRGAHGPRGPLTGPPAGLPAAGPVVAWTQGYDVARADPVAAALRGALEQRCRRVLQLWAPLMGWSLLARGAIDAFVGYRAEGVDLPAGALLAAEAGVELRTLAGEPFRPGFSGPGSGRSFVAGRGATLDYVLEEVARATAR
ncbi:inositol monophosphatase [Streptomyces spiroverticillatus]|uniref:Inositol monophosphatase n=1 Tax=Streptomyces finlayi TaxID=67296 RepID=A0A918WX68_9ACTN|nr:inositol monophosphatase family protein [Streptomyces finlayi]GGZ92727.1 inositol monophosphatase [Streptomyces spiroverticillatus]GHC92835.1 inositol monophosphatase [Streptomyces finlayi]